MVCTLDLHAHLTQRMVDACDATVLYQTNPHLDQRARGKEAARLLLRTLRGEINPTQAAAMPPISINIEKQLTAQSPCAQMYTRSAQLREHDKVLSHSIALGFPYADVAEMGAGFVCITDNDPALAQTLADEMAQWLLDHRHAFVAELISVEDAIEQACTSGGPVCLLDMGDNVGGGSAGDGTYIAQAVLARGGPKTFVSVFDPPTVRHALHAGLGATLELAVGGKTDKMHGLPLQSTFTISKIHDGKFKERQTRHGGKIFYDMGPTVLLDTPCALTVQVTTHRTTPFSLGQVSCCVDPTQFQILVAKGVNAPVAAYAQVCDTFIRVNTAGSTSADMTSLNYQHRRRPLFPFEEIEQ
ncbi:MAG: microcystin degradation protein MlrC [Gammaproteobacteria bacterium]|jgi:microcystin degradation protein MlrC